MLGAALQTKPLVIIRSTEDVSDDVQRGRVGLLRGKADYGDTVEQRENVRGEDLSATGLAVRNGTCRTFRVPTS